VQNISLPIFSYWRKKLISQSKQGQDQPCFTAIVPEKQVMDFEITYPNGGTVNTGTCTDHVLPNNSINLFPLPKGFFLKLMAPFPTQDTIL
jgi:hypothetical protein